MTTTDEAAEDTAADLVVVGPGAAGLTAALAAAATGASVTILEASDRFGGTTAVSGGQRWLPGNHHTTERGAVPFNDQLAG